MRKRKATFQTPRLELEILADEHTAIRNHHQELDETILHAEGSPRILKAAGVLVQSMLQHFTHEEEFHKKIALRADTVQRTAGIDLTAELLRIEAGLQEGEVYAALRLRGLCKRWMRGHLEMENAEFEISPLVVANDAAANAAVNSAATPNRL
jgi:hypothetical protein